jgi:hypothetical protein
LPSNHPKENLMVKHVKKTAVGLAALIALALGGSALAQAGGTTAKPTPAPAATSTTNEAPGTESAPDRDGPAGHADESTAAGAQKPDATDRDNVQSGDQSGPEAPDAAEKGESAQEKPESASETSGSEVAGDDGPGGHADEPANPNADHQNEGTE